jgi:hypothetical protein
MITPFHGAQASLPAARRHPVGNLPARYRERFCTLVSSVRQHSSDTIHVAIRDQNVNVQMSLPFIRFLRQDVARVRMAAFDLARGGNAKSLRRAFMCF